MMLGPFGAMVAKLIRARFISPCPYCGFGIAVRQWVQLAETQQWMHPICAKASDAGKTYKTFLLERKIAKRAKEIAAERVAEEQRAPSRDHASDYF